MKFNSIVPSNVPPRTNIISYLAARFTYHTDAGWIETVNSGKITLGDRVASVNDFVIPGTVMVYDPGEFEEPAANLDYRIVYEDEWFVGISKPGNLLVHRAGKSFKNNLIYQLRYVHQPPFSTAHSTHRLDRDTSGVVLVAKNSEACAEIGVQFAAGQVKKEYVAIVHGQIDPTISEIRLPIGKATDSTISYKFWTNPEGKDAVTRIVGSEQFGNAYSLVYLQPITGRTHQIRVHLAATGYPIVGDKLYGMTEDAYKRWRENPATSQITFQFYRHALHCRSLVFNHPFLKTICRIEAAIPDDMIDLQIVLKNEEK